MPDTCAVCEKKFRVKDGKTQSVEIGNEELCMSKKCWATSRERQGFNKREVEASRFIRPDYGGAL
jgi:hypothetical protein